MRYHTDYEANPSEPYGARSRTSALIAGITFYGTLLAIFIVGRTGDD
jgi:hypothetical protein